MTSQRKAAIVLGSIIGAVALSAIAGFLVICAVVFLVGNA